MIEYFRKIRLHPTARALYEDMLYQASGKREFTYPKSVYEQSFGKDAFFSGKKALIEAGLIEIVQNNANLRKPNVYRFSTSWKER